MIFYKI